MVDFSRAFGLLNQMVERIDIVFKALGDPVRLQMVQTLIKGPISVSDLAEPLDMSLTGASKHVGVLEASGLLQREKKGRERICRLCPEGLFAARDWVEKYSKFWNERLDALDAALKEDGND